MDKLITIILFATLIAACDIQTHCDDPTVGEDITKYPNRALVEQTNEWDKFAINSVMCGRKYVVVQNGEIVAVWGFQ